MLVGCFLVGCSVFETPKNSVNNPTGQGLLGSGIQSSSNGELSTDSSNHTGLEKQLQAPGIDLTTAANYPESLSFESCKQAPTGAIGVSALEMKEGPGGWVFALTSDGRILKWKPGKLCFGTYQGTEKSLRISHFALSPDAKLLSFSVGGLIRVFDLESGTLVARLGKSEATVTVLLFDLHSSSLFIARADGFLYRWGFRETAQFRDRGLEPLQRYTGLSSIPSALVLHPTGRFFFSADWSGAIYAWIPYDQLQFASRYQENLFVQQGWFAQPASVVGDARVTLSPVERIVMLSDGKLFLAARRDGVVELWRVRGFQKVNEVKVQEGEVLDLAADSVGGRVATVGRDGTLRIWNLTREPDELVGDKPSSLSLLKEMPGVGAKSVLFRGSNKILVSSSDGILKEYSL